MRKLGLIGGMSWVSTRSYYDRINRIVQRADPKSSAPLLIESLDFAQLYRLQDDGDWQRAGEVLSDSARRLEQAGAGALIIAANSMHRVYDQVAALHAAIDALVVRAGRDPAHPADQAQLAQPLVPPSAPPEWR